MLFALPSGPRSRLAAALLFAVGCVDADGSSMPWQRSATFHLPAELREISALGALGEGDLVAALQDEQGRAYVLDASSGRIVDSVAFGPDGDYEGIEAVGEHLYALTSDGTLHEVRRWRSPSRSVRTHATGLGEEACNAEGLGYHQASDRLLIVCKEAQADEEAHPVYAFDRAEARLEPDPVLRVPSRLGTGRDGTLRPSALAVEPGTGRIVVLASGADALVALEPDGAVAAVWTLGKEAFEQPEGLAFLPGGDLLVASEGNEGAPVLARFAPTGR